jgi:hypothetical protein
VHLINVYLLGISLPDLKNGFDTVLNQASELLQAGRGTKHKKNSFESSDKQRRHLLNVKVVID